MRHSCRRATTGAWKHRWIGTRRTPIWSGERTKLQVFSMRSMASGAAFHCAYLHATQQAFLEAHELAFAYFCGVFRKLRYDNLTSAVKKILRGYRREETARFIAFRSHWRFDKRVLHAGRRPMRRAAWKERSATSAEITGCRCRRRSIIADLNRQLLDACHRDEQRRIAGREQTVGAALLIEREHLLPLAAEGMDLAQTSFPTVNSLGCVESPDQRLFGAVEGQARRCRPRCTPARSSSGMTGSAWLAMSDATAGSSRSSISSITWTCCRESRAHWPDRGRWSSNAELVSGRTVSTRSGRR